MRRFEEEIFEFYKKGMMAGLAHLYMGEEAVATVEETETVEA